jgi:hypothetical protein
LPNGWAAKKKRSFKPKKGKVRHHGFIIFKPMYFFPSNFAVTYSHHVYLNQFMVKTYILSNLLVLSGRDNQPAAGSRGE